MLENNSKKISLFPVMIIPNYLFDFYLSKENMIDYCWLNYLQLYYSAYSFIIREHMSEDNPNLVMNQISNCACLDILEIAFPNISRMPIDNSFLNDPALKRLVNLIKFSIPVHTYQPELLALYDRINELYYDYIFRNSLQQKESNVEHNVSLENKEKAEEKVD